MKKLITAITLLGALTGSAKVHAFNVQAQVNFNPLKATASVYNRFNRPIICDINATGYTYYGQSLYSYMDRVVIHPGMNGYAYVYSNPGNPFVNVSGNADCYWY